MNNTGILCTSLLVLLLGGLGGLVNCFHSGEFHLPQTDKKAGIWRPGWVGVVVVGAAAALVVWGLYGPAGSYIFNADTPQKIPITVSQIINSLLVGFGGGRFLHMAVEKKADEFTKLTLTQALTKAISK